MIYQKKAWWGFHLDIILLGNDIAWPLILMPLKLIYEAALPFDRLVNFLKQLHSVMIMGDFNVIKIRRHGTCGIGQLSFAWKQNLRYSQVNHWSLTCLGGHDTAAKVFMRVI